MVNTNYIINWLPQLSIYDCTHCGIEPMVNSVQYAYYIYTKQHFFIGEAVEVQENLLDPLKSNLKPSDSFLQIFGKIVSINWPHLASQLSLSTTDIMKELKRIGRLSAPADQALFMLQKWKTKEEATYGLLCERLRTVLLMQ